MNESITKEPTKEPTKELTMFLDTIESKVYDYINEQIESGNTDIEEMHHKLSDMYLSEWCKDSVEECKEHGTSLINGIMEEFKSIMESDDKENKEDKEDKEDDEDDSEDEEKDEEECVDEASLTKHKISKIQSIIDKRKRETDPKLKASRRKTLMKQNARGGRVVNKKLSKSLKKSYKQGYGARWESELSFDELESGLRSVLESSEEKNDVDGTDVEPKEDKKKKVAKVLSKEAKAQSEAIKESVREALKTKNIYGSLNEEESTELVESFSSLLSEQLDTAIQTVTEGLLEKLEDYHKTVVIPEFTNKMEGYIKESVIPALEKDVNSYLEYVTEELSTELNESGKIVKCRDSAQLESFRDKLLNLIESELQIIPEQQDALIASENRCAQLLESVREAHLERIKMRDQALEYQNKLWIEQNLPSGISEASEEKLREKLGLIESETHEEFVNEATREIRKFGESKESTVMTEENIENHKKEEPKIDIVTRTLSLLNR